MPNKFDLTAWQDARDERIEKIQSISGLTDAHYGPTEPKLTACKDCRHFLDQGSMTWQKRCGATPKELSWSPINGAYRDNGFMSVYFVNTDGACAKFVERRKEN